MRFVGDNPIDSPEQDMLGMSAFLNLMAQSIRSTETPFVYGILGDWGTGKTSSMNLLMKELVKHPTNSQHFVPIWFNAWKYENEANMVYPLLHAIKKAHDEYVESIAPGRADARSFGQKFLKVVTTSALAVSDLALRALTKKVFDQALSVKDIREHMQFTEDDMKRLEGAMGSWADNVSEMEEAFAALINAFAGNYSQVNDIPEEQITFLILIDDLDRCLPHSTIAILESIKNYLSVPKCVFVLGLNPAVVYAGIQHKFLGVNVSGREYLEKIVNYSFYVPEPDAANIVEFAKSRLEDLYGQVPPQQNQAAHWQAFGNVLSECRFSNPRKIKRIVNRYLLFLDQYANELDKYDIGNVAKLIVQAEYFPDLFQLYFTHGALIDQLQQVGTEQFDLNNFERNSGLSVAGDYAHLSRLRNLFKVTNPLPPKFDRARHVKDVFAIARLR